MNGAWLGSERVHDKLWSKKEVKSPTFGRVLPQSGKETCSSSSACVIWPHTDCCRLSLQCMIQVTGTARPGSRACQVGLSRTKIWFKPWHGMVPAS